MGPQNEPSLLKAFERLGGRVDISRASSLDSTQSLASALIDEAEAADVPLANCLILASVQSSGRGRQERAWDSLAGNLHMTYLRVNLPTETLVQLPMIAAGVMVGVLRDHGREVGIKWPNDLILDGAKVGGFLIDVRSCGGHHRMACGLGLNLSAAPELDGRLPAGSLDLEGMDVELAVSFVEAFEIAVSDPGPALEFWRTSSIHREGEILEVDFEGTRQQACFKAIAADGALLVEIDGIPQTLR